MYFVNKRVSFNHFPSKSDAKMIDDWENGSNMKKLYMDDDWETRSKNYYAIYES